MEYSVLTQNILSGVISLNVLQWTIRSKSINGVCYYAHNYSVLQQYNFCDCLHWQFLDMVPNTLSYRLDCSISPISSSDFHSFLYSYFHKGLLYLLRGPFPL